MNYCNLNFENDVLMIEKTFGLSYADYLSLPYEYRKAIISSSILLHHDQNIILDNSINKDTKRKILSFFKK